MTGPWGMGPLISGFATVLNPLVIFENFVESLTPTHWFKCNEVDGSLQNSGSGTGVFNPVETGSGIEYEVPFDTPVIGDVASVRLDKPGVDREYFESVTLSPSVTADQPFSFFLMFDALEIPDDQNRLLYHDGIDDISMFTSGLMVILTTAGSINTMLALNGSIRISTASDTDSIVPNTFNSLGYTYDGSFVRMFLNGVMFNKTEYSGGYSVNTLNNRVRLGFQNGSLASDRGAWAGKLMHLIRWHDVVLTEANMIELHNLSGGFDAPPVGTDRFTGGTITYDAGDVVHTFLSNDTLTFLGGPPVDCHVFKVGGGGGGGSVRGGGGGGGGGVVDELSVMIGHTLTVNVGAGGIGANGIADNSAGRQGQSGTNTGLTTLFSVDFGQDGIGGGGGTGAASSGSANGIQGGCGGGGGSGLTSRVGGNGLQGGDGGDGFQSGTVANRAGGGGGGALSSVTDGQDATSANGGDGGIGYLSDITGTSTRYGGGGGGGCGTPANAGIGGDGGGTNGQGGTAACTDAAANTGGGGGGNNGNSGAGLSAAGDGGSGILVVRYPEGG